MSTDVSFYNLNAYVTCLTVPSVCLCLMQTKLFLCLLPKQTQAPALAAMAIPFLAWLFYFHSVVFMETTSNLS